MGSIQSTSAVLGDEELVRGRVLELVGTQKFRLSSIYVYIMRVFLDCIQSPKILHEQIGFSDPMTAKDFALFATDGPVTD